MGRLSIGGNMYNSFGPERTSGPCCRCGKLTGWDDEYCTKCNQLFDDEQDILDQRYELPDQFLAKANALGWCVHAGREKEHRYYSPNVAKIVSCVTLPITSEVYLQGDKDLEDAYDQTYFLLSCAICDDILESEQLPYLREEDYEDNDYDSNYDND